MNTVTPLDPNSPKGHEVATRLTRVLAEIQVAIDDRERRAARDSEQVETERRAA